MLMRQGGNLNDILIWGLILVLIGDILILWAALVERKEKEC
ncbi:MAG: hypothetical protein H6Q67_1182 [Firmicutes bacterium]|nr:hypothetical protein [Bacillota bacterium]